MINSTASLGVSLVTFSVSHGIEMKKILLIVALIAAGYYIYSDFLSPSYKYRTLSDKELRAKKLFDKVLTTPVSAHEARPVFKDSMIDNCEKLGGNTDNGYGTTAECINDFETNASEQCFSKLADFEGKIYTSLDTLGNDYLAYYTCAMAIVGSASLFEKKLTVTENKVTLRELLNKVSSTPVSAQELKSAFMDQMIETCKKKGVNTNNGYGTTAECINNFERLASEQCVAQRADFEGKIYTSRDAITMDSLLLARCAHLIVKSASSSEKKLTVPEKKLTVSENKVTIIDLFNKVSTTPVSAQELKSVFISDMIEACKKFGSNTDNGYGTTAECINNFERLASEPCVAQRADFESKMYTSKDDLRKDSLLLARCAHFIIKSASLYENKVTIIDLFNKVSTTPVSAQELKSAFNSGMIEACKKFGSNTDNGYGTTAECINNFETLASEQCVSQLADFEGKIYTSKDDLRNDSLLLARCAHLIIKSASLSPKKLTVPEKNVTVSENKATIGELINKVASTPVSTHEVKQAFKDLTIKVCKINGVDTDNGYGTTTECLNKFETLASEHCFDQLVDFKVKVYTSKRELITDYKAFSFCAGSIVAGKFNP